MNLRINDMPKVTVAIPTYNRADYLKGAIRSILAQSFQDFKIIIFDNASDYDVAGLVSDFNDSRISLIFSEVNIGNAGNFKKVFDYKYDTEYLIVFHDDDMMHPDLLSLEIGLMEEDKNIVLSGAALNFINDHGLMDVFVDIPKDIKISFFDDYRGLVRLILKDFDLSFDSVMYRTEHLVSISSYQDQFFKWADRPFLIDVAKAGSVAVIKAPLVNYRIHGGQDSQTEAGDKKDYLFSLFKFYKNNLSEPLNLRDRRLFYYFSTNQIILSSMGFSDNFSEYIDFIKSAKKRGLFLLRYVNIRGVYYFFKFLKKLF